MKVEDNIIKDIKYISGILIGLSIMFYFGNVKAGEATIWNVIGIFIGFIIFVYGMSFTETTKEI